MQEKDLKRGMRRNRNTEGRQKWKTQWNWINMKYQTEQEAVSSCSSDLL